MNAKIVAFGTTAVIIAITIAVVLVPVETHTAAYEPSDIWRPYTQLEARGRIVYKENGCHYCHSQYIRSVDWDLGAERLAQAGDYVGQKPVMLGSMRTGPDLSQAGGEHTDDWHEAHFWNPRYVRPESIMPRFEWLGPARLPALIAYVQSLGLKDADRRVRRQLHWRAQAIQAYERGADENIRWLHELVPEGWRKAPNPYPFTPVARERGATIYQRWCLGCHGPVGDGQGPASAFIYPPPLNFTTLARHPDASGGLLYYQIMNGITGTAMPYFKRELESEKIWDVSNYVAEYFIGKIDANQEPRGIDASYEPAPEFGEPGEGGRP
jgi:cbb3-type cytochrome oxidase cytochrome c subunit/mono/diheme cytochrome c family protein